MAGNNVLRFGVPIANQVQTIQKVGGSGAPVRPSVRHQTGQCGIPPLRPPPPPPPKAPEKFPPHLMRPPCMPGMEVGRDPGQCVSMRGLYCPPERPKYKYPPFSENIEFTPSGTAECWWVKPHVCEEVDTEEDLPLRM